MRRCERRTAVSSAPTPRPWMTEVLGHTLRVTDQRDAEGLADDVAVVGDCTDPENIANAAHIVLCVNTHDELLEACKAASEQMEESFDPSEFAPFIAEQIRAVIDRLDAAIARAEGRQA